jgi:hypothetical protein
MKDRFFDKGRGDLRKVNLVPIEVLVRKRPVLGAAIRDGRLLFPAPPGVLVGGTRFFVILLLKDSSERLFGRKGVNSGFRENNRRYILRQAQDERGV